MPRIFILYYMVLKANMGLTASPPSCLGSKFTFSMRSTPIILSKIALVPYSGSPQCLYPVLGSFPIIHHIQQIINFTNLLCPWFLISPPATIQMPRGILSNLFQGPRIVPCSQRPISICELTKWNRKRN